MLRQKTPSRNFTRWRFCIMLMLSTDGFANSYKNADEFQKTCVDYFAMIQQYGADAVAANLKSWLSETSAMGCGDDITVLIAYFSDDTATESEAIMYNKLRKLETA